MRRLFWPIGLVFLLAAAASGQAPRPKFTHADTLRGTNGPARAWWDVTFYDLHVAISPRDSTIRGSNVIAYRVLKPATEMQIDLQVPMEIDSVVQDERQLKFRRDSNAFFVKLVAPQQAAAR